VVARHQRRPVPRLDQQGTPTSNGGEPHRVLSPRAAASTGPSTIGGDQRPGRSTAVGAVMPPKGSPASTVPPCEELVVPPRSERDPNHTGVGHRPANIQPLNAPAAIRHGRHPPSTRSTAPRPAGCAALAGGDGESPARPKLRLQAAWRTVPSRAAGSRSAGRHCWPRPPSSGGLLLSLVPVPDQRHAQQNQVPKQLGIAAPSRPGPASGSEPADDGLVLGSEPPQPPGTKEPRSSVPAPEPGRQHLPDGAFGGGHSSSLSDPRAEISVRRHPRPRGATRSPPN